MTIHAIFFDIGGVLARTIDPAPRQRLAARFGMSASTLLELVYGGESGTRAQRGEIPLDQHWQTVCNSLHIPVSDLDAFREEFWGGDVIDQDLIAYLRELHGTYRTGLISNAFGDVRQAVSEWGFADALDTMVFSAEVGLLKPDPRIFHLALESLDLQPNQAVFIDDFLHNIESARSVGMHGIHFREPEQARDELEQLLAEDGNTHQ